MTQNALTAAEPAEQEFNYSIKIEEAGPATKRVTVEIPADRIATKLTEQFKELRADLALPGFRPGHAPQKLVEKKFSSDVREQVRRFLVKESYEQAVKKNSLQVIGEPEFDNPEAIKLPESGPMNYTFSVEVQPTFDIPDLTNLRVKRPHIEVKAEHVDKAVEKLLEQQGTLIPVEGRGVEGHDRLFADVHVKVDGAVVAHQHDQAISIDARNVAGHSIDDLAGPLAGMKPGETRSVTTTLPPEYPRPELRGKTAELEITLKAIHRMELPTLDAAFLEQLGFDSPDDLKGALREQMEQRVKADVRQSMRDQVLKFLLDTVFMELPTKLSNSQEERVVQRTNVDLQVRGVSPERVVSLQDGVRASAREQGSLELKKFFILNKLAQQENIDVSEQELNGMIAELALRRDVRPEKLKQELSSDGQLAYLYMQMRESKALDAVLDKVHIDDVEPEPAAAPAATPTPAESSAPADAPPTP
jgi:trigger factor